MSVLVPVLGTLLVPVPVPVLVPVPVPVLVLAFTLTLTLTLTPTLTLTITIKPGLYFERKSTPCTQTILRTWGAYSRPPMPIYAV